MRCARERRLRVDRQWLRSPGSLGEVEIGAQVAQHRGVLTHAGSRIRTPVGARIEALATQEVILDELDIGIEAQLLVVDVAMLGLGADHDAWYTEAVAVRVLPRRNDVIVEAAPVVPGEENGG